MRNHKNKKKVSGLSKKELEIVSFLELEERFFFTRADIGRFFCSEHLLSVFLYRLKKKGRIRKINRSKYYLIPVRARGGHWSEHPFIIVDEIFNGEGYYISGMAAAHYWGLIEQLPTKVEVKCTGKQGRRSVFGVDIIFRRQRAGALKNFVKREVQGRGFLISSKEATKKWLESR